MSRKSRTVCFGEIMLRMTAPGHEMLLQSPKLEATVGGAEANVAVAMSHFGDDASFVTILPDNALGRAVLGEVRKHGVDTSGVHFAKGRLGLYFVTLGAGVRASDVLYDRVRSAFAEAKAELIDWSTVLTGADRLHLSGVTPATGPNGAAAAERAAMEAARLGVKLSFDGNFRATLWSQWDGDAPGILGRILAQADIAFIDERDLALILKRSFKDRLEAFEAAFAAFPRLERIACTARAVTPAGAMTLAASLHTRTHATHAAPILLGDVIDRIGSGDAFVAGLLHALTHQFDAQKAIDFALAAAAWKCSVPGDFLTVPEAALLQFLSDGVRDVRR
jgi:2-dehydro-3-deoxygluconokinase